MTTTQADAPTAVQAPDLTAGGAWRAPAVPAARRSIGKWVIVAAVVVAAGVAAWLGLRMLGRDNSSDAIMTYVAEPRTFDVILSEKGELDASNKIDVKCEVEGRTRIIWLVPEGKQVEKGELLVELASDQIQDKIQQQELKETGAKVAYEAAVKEDEIQRDKNESDIRKADVALTIAKLKLEKYQKGDWVQQQTDADLEIDRAVAVLDRKTEDLQYSEELVKKKYITMSDYKDDQFEEYQAKVALEKAKLAKQILNEYTHPTQLEQLESDVREAGNELERVKKSAEANNDKSEANVKGKETEWSLAKQQLDKLREQLSKCKISAPGSGLVVYENSEGFWRGGDNRIAEGEEVYERQTILSIPDTSSMKVIARVHEAKTDKIKLGQEARIEIEGLPGRDFAGKVTKIAAVADSRNRWLNPDLKEYRTEITLDKSDPDMKPGVTARVEIFVERVEAPLAIPVQAVYSKGGKSYVFAENRGSAEPIEVGLGRSNNEFVEVLSGLARGQEVRTVIDDALKRKLPEVSDEQPGEPPGANPRRFHRAGGNGENVGEGAGARPDQEKSARPNQETRARPDPEKRARRKDDATTPSAS